MERLRFSSAATNSKLKRRKDAKQAYTFSLPAGGKCCPFAKICRTTVGEDGKLHDGKYMELRCFGALSELRSKSLRNLVRDNWKTLQSVGLRNVEAMTNLIVKSLPSDAKRVRVHTTGGDYMTPEYLQAWVRAARVYDDVLFYGYTKALDYLVSLKQSGEQPDNLRIVASRGGTQDELIEEHGLVEARIVYHPSEAIALGLEIDHDDSMAMSAEKSFALLLHGQQPAGTKASEAIQRMKKEEISFSYN